MTQTFVQKWPEEIPVRTSEEWNALLANWSDTESRNAILGALKALKIPATTYARIQPNERVELIILHQEALIPGSTAKKAAAAPAATSAAAPAAAAAKPGKAATAVPAGKAAAPAAATVDLTPITTELAALNAKIDALQATSTRIETILKLLLLNAANADALSLAADADTLADIAGKTITELAGGNG